MDVKNIKKIDGINFYKASNFATVACSYMFTYPDSFVNNVKADLLSTYLIRTNSVYKTRKEINDKCKDLYGLRLSITSYSIGVKNFFAFTFFTPSAEVVLDNYFRDAVDFFKTMALFPNFNEGKLDSEVFESIKKENIDYESGNVKNAKLMNYRMFYKSVFPNTEYSNSVITDIEEYKKIINSISERDIIDFYNEILNNFVESYLFGNVSDQDAKYLANCMNFKKCDFDYVYDHKEEPIDKDIEIADDSTTESNLYVVYSIKNYDVNKSYLYKAVVHMLNDMNGLPLKILRNKYGLVYSSYGQIYYKRGYMIINAAIDKKNKEAALNAIDEIIEALKDRCEVEKLLNYSKEKESTNVFANEERVSAQIDELLSYIMKSEEPSADILKKIEGLEVNDIIEFTNSLEKRCVFFYMGCKDEK